LLAKGLVFARRNSASKCILYWIFTENNALRLLTNIRKYQRFGYYDATVYLLTTRECIALAGFLLPKFFQLLADVMLD